MSSWVWPRLWSRTPSRPIRRHAQVLANPCPCCGGRMTSSRPSRPAASQATGRLRLSAQSDRALHDRRQLPASMPTSVFLAGHRPATPILARNGVRHCLQPGFHLKEASSRLLPPSRSVPPAGAVTQLPRPNSLKHIRSPPLDRHSPRPAFRRLYSPRVPSLEAFGQRPQCQPIVAMAVIRNPSHKRKLCRRGRRARCGT